MERTDVVNLHHATALALVTWYLIMPHALPNSPEPNLALPLSQWSRIGPVLSKSDCEARLSASLRKIDDPAQREKLAKQLPSLRAQAQAMWPNQKIPDSYFYKDYWDDLRRYFKLSTCIASDDPRLAE